MSALQRNNRNSRPGCCPTRSLYGGEATGVPAAFQSLKAHAAKEQSDLDEIARRSGGNFGGQPRDSRVSHERGASPRRGNSTRRVLVLLEVLGDLLPNPDLTLDEIHEEMIRRGESICVRTVRRDMQTLVNADCLIACGGQWELLVLVRRKGQR